MKITFHQRIFWHCLQCPSNVTAWVLGSGEKHSLPWLGTDGPFVGRWLCMTVPSSPSCITLLITRNSGPEADSTPAGNSLCGLLGSHFSVPFSDSQHWNWVAVPSADRTLPLGVNQWISKAAIPCLHRCELHLCRRSLWDEGERCLLPMLGDFQGYRSWILFFGGFFCKTFGFERKTHFKGLFEKLRVS